VLIGSPYDPLEEDRPDSLETPNLEEELATIKNEMADLRKLLEKMSTDGEEKNE
jgi:hypothetical protein